MVRDNGAEAGVALREDAQTDSTRYLMIRHADLAGPIQLLFNRAWRGAKPFS